MGRKVPISVAGDFVGVGRHTLFRWVAQQRIHAYKYPQNSRTYVDEAEVWRELPRKGKHTGRPVLRPRGAGNAAWRQS